MLSHPSRSPLKRIVTHDGFSEHLAQIRHHLVLGAFNGPRGVPSGGQGGLRCGPGMVFVAASVHFSWPPAFKVGGSGTHFVLIQGRQRADAGRART